MPMVEGEAVRLLDLLAHRDGALDDLSPEDFEGFVAFLLGQRGYRIDSWRRAQPFGDILVEADDPWHLRSLGVIECKKHRPGRPIDREAVEQARSAAAYLNADWAAVVATSRFTRAAALCAEEQEPVVKLVDRRHLMVWAAEARAARELLAGSIAFRMNRLSGEELGRVAVPDNGLVRPKQLLLAPDHASRLERVEQLPFRLLQAVLADPRVIRRLEPRQFEEFVCETVDKLGFRNIILTPRSGDGGRDVIASRVVHGIPLAFYFECKKYAEGNKVQLDSLRALLGVVAHHATEANIGVLVTTSTFTSGGKQLIAAECRLDGKDYDGLMGWVSGLQRTHPPPSA